VPGAPFFLPPEQRISGMNRKELKALLKEVFNEVLDEREAYTESNPENRHEQVKAALTAEWQSNLDIVAATKLTSQIVNGTLRDLAAWGEIERKQVKSRGAQGFKWMNRLAEGD
jgi:hypothetical protein